VAQGGDIREHSWDGGVWSDTTIDAISGATVDIAVGRGRNDDTMRVYVTSANGLLYEFTNTSPYVGIESLREELLKVSLSVQPNPTANSFSVSYSLSRSGMVVLSLHNSLGSQVCRLVDGFQSAGKHVVNCYSVDRYGMQLPAGIYFCRLILEGTETIEKIVRLR
jgi:hypothetical protein